MQPESELSQFIEDPIVADAAEPSAAPFIELSAEKPKDPQDLSEGVKIIPETKPPFQSIAPQKRVTDRRYAFIMCVLLLVLFVVAERSYEYFVQGKITYPAAAASPVSGVAAAVSPITNEIQPILPQPPTSAGQSTPGSATQPAPVKPAVPVNPFSTISASAYLVGNAKTGQIYFSHDASAVLPIASLSKLTAALVARQFMNQGQIVPITQQVMDVYSNAYGIELGEKFSVSELYYPLLLQSNDNVAEALAYAYGPDGLGPDALTSATSTDTAFVEKMNEYASELGMEHSHFLDVSGLSDGNVSTANDLFVLAQFLYADKFSDNSLTPNLLAITTMQDEYVATTTDHFSHDFVNINPFAGSPAFVGGKTGRTNAAGETMLSIFNYADPDGQTDPIAIVVLHSDYGTRQVDTQKLLAIVENGIASGKY